MAVTADDVREICPAAEDLTDAQIEAAIAVATVIAEASSCYEALSDAVKDMAVKFLAAHLLTWWQSNGSGALTAMSLGDASESYATTHLGEGLRSTSFGLTAIALAPCLQSVSAKRAHIEVI